MPDSAATPPVRQGAFLESPARGLAGIYRDLHDWKVDSGIKSALTALKEVDALYAKDPGAVINDRALITNKAYQIKSTLHTMLGMLYYRKSMTALRDAGSGAEEAVMQKIKDGKDVSEADLEAVAREAEGGRSADAARDAMIAMAINEFKTASEVDPANPSPHYQMAAIYSAMPPVDSASMAEDEYFRGAELSIKEGRKDVAQGALEAIRTLNPESVYIARIEGMLKQ